LIVASVEGLHLINQAMPESAQPEVLLPHARTRVGGRLFADQNLELLAHVLDDWFRIPGTSIRFGLDGIIGLVPGLGDVLTGLASCIIVIAAWFRGIPYVTLTRMVVNLGIDVFIGAIPFLGDIFDIAWKANRRNYALMTRHLQQPHRHTWKDYFFLMGILAILAVIFAAPIVVLVLLTEYFLHRGLTP